MSVTEQTPEVRTLIASAASLTDGMSADDMDAMERECLPPKPFVNLLGEVFAEPGALSIIDTINPRTGRSSINGETLEQVRERYPTAEIVDFDAWIADKAAAQDAPVRWDECTEEVYGYMLGVLPPERMAGGAFLVGEPADHHAATGAPRFDGFRYVYGKYLATSRPITIREFNAMLAGTSAHRAAL